MTAIDIRGPVCGLLCIFFSAGLITFNKFLISEDRFPYAVPLVMSHMVVSCSVSGVLLYFFPSMFPSITDPERPAIPVSLFYKGLLPISLFFVAQLVLSNTAYLFSSVPFLQMMKESNLVLVYFFSVAFALEMLNYRNLGILCFIIAATFMTIKGEIHFSLIGFFLQGSSQLCESMKIVLQGLLLNNKSAKLDPLSYVLFMTPSCLFFLSCLSAVLYIHPMSSLRVPTSFGPIITWAPLIFLNACVACCLNIVTSFFLKYSSPVAFIMAGICKDVMIVVISCIVLAEEVSKVQLVGFMLQLSGIGLWSVCKTFPEYFEDGLLDGIQTLLGMKVRGDLAKLTTPADEKLAKC